MSVVLTLDDDEFLELLYERVNYWDSDSEGKGALLKQYYEYQINNDSSLFDNTNVKQLVDNEYQNVDSLNDAYSTEEKEELFLEIKEKLLEDNIIDEEDANNENFNLYDYADDITGMETSNVTILFCSKDLEDILLQN